MRFVLLTLLALCCQSLRAEEPKLGTLKGRFVFDGEAPKPTELTVDKDRATCAKGKLFDESLIVNEKTHGIANIVIQLQAEKPPQHPDLKKLRQQNVEFKMTACRYEPHVCLVLTQQTLKFVNDAIGHNPRIHISENRPDGDLIPGGKDLRKLFRSAEKLPVSVSCSIHPWMQGYLIITDHPYVAVTNAQGEFSIPALPPGEWTFRVWQERAGLIKQVTRADKTTEEWPKGKFKVTLTSETYDLGDIRVSPQVFEKK